MEDHRAPERYTLHVCADCKQPAHSGDRCPRDRRRVWTQMEGIEYVRADLHRGAVEAERERIANYLRSRAADSWDPSVEAALRLLAGEIEHDHHHGGR